MQGNCEGGSGAGEESASRWTALIASGPRRRSPAALLVCGEPRNSARTCAVGRSRGGSISKTYGFADGRSRPAAFSLRPGNIADINRALLCCRRLSPLDAGSPADGVTGLSEYSATSRNGVALRCARSTRTDLVPVAIAACILSVSLGVLNFVRALILPSIPLADGSRSYRIGSQHVTTLPVQGIN